MSKPRECVLKGEARFTLPTEQVDSFEKRRKSGNVRVSVSVEVVDSVHVLGFTAADIVTGSFEVTRDTGKSASYHVKVDAIVRTDLLRPKDWAQVEAGKATCRFFDIGDDDEWLRDAEFPDGDRLVIETTASPGVKAPSKGPARKVSSGASVSGGKAKKPKGGGTI
jgi:hypothetical protein